MVATVTNITVASSTVHYFERDGYYAKSDPAHRRASFWHGRCATGLGRHVGPKRFQSILEGYVPKTDIRLGRIRDGRHEHRPGVDITFSAPKSVSLAALLDGDRRVMRAHDEAVRAALDYVEDHLLQTREYDPATRRRPRVKAHGMIAATFRHLVSRNLDPQLHTHCVVANITRGSAGDWRSIEPTALHRRKKLIGAHYRNELARRLQELGYEIVPTMIGPVPGFEIAGYGRAVREAFSTRRRDILEDIRRRGVAYSAARAQQAALYTRARKAEPAKEELAAIWRSRASEVGLDLEAGGRRARRGNGGAQASVSRAPSALTAVWRSVEHLEERASVFAGDELLAFALGLAPGRFSVADVNAAIDGLRRDKHLVEARLRGHDRAFVTDRALRAEKVVVAWMKGSAGEALADRQMIEDRLAASDLTQGQRDAVQTVLLTPARVVGVQGYAGTGKTRMVREVVELVGDRQVVGLAPSANAAQVLGRTAGIPARTLQWFLTRHRDIAGDGPERLARARRDFAGSILVVDEASMIATAQMRSLMRIVEQLRIARLVLVGDRRQLRAVEAGQPFRQLQAAGMLTAEMDDIRRQRNPDLKAAVTAMLAGDPGRAIEGLEVHELPAEDLGENAARLWLDLGPEARAGTAILAPTHLIREDINGAVREGLRDEGVLHGARLEIKRLVSLGLTRAQKADLANYWPGDVVVFHQDLYPYRIKADDACTVAGIEDGRVLLDHPDGRPRRIDPSKPVRYRLDIFETRTIQLQAGDRIRWTRNDKKRALINGHQAVITAIGPRRVRLRTQDGRTLSLDREDGQLRHLDHAYSSTVHAAQSVTADNVIAVLDSGAMSDQSMLYVEISRARDNAVLVTDDCEDLIERLEADSGERPTAHEAIGEDPWVLPDKEVLHARVTERRHEQHEAPRVRRSAGQMAEASIKPESPSVGDLYAGFLRDWQEHHELAKSVHRHPFYMSGYDGLVGRMEALASRPDLDESMRSVLTGYSKIHHRLKKDRADVEDWLSQANRELSEEGEDLSHARERAQRLLASGQKILDDNGRYGVHLDDIRDSRTPILKALGDREELVRSIDLQTGLLEDWRSHARRARAAGRHPLYAKGLDDIVARLEQLDRLAVLPIPEELSRLINGLDARKTVERATRDLRTALDHRRDLLRDAAGEAVASMPGYGRWQAMAAQALASGQTILADEDRFGEHLDNIKRARRLIGRGVGELERAAAVDDLAAGILRDGQARNAANYGALAARAKELAARATKRGEMPAAVSRIVEEHKELASARATVEKNLSALREIADSRRRLLEKAGDRAPATVRGYKRWMKNADKAMAETADILRDGERYGQHIDKTERTYLRGALRDMDLWRSVDALPARFLLDWQDHVKRAEAAGVSAFDAPGYEDIARRMESLARRWGANSTARSVLEAELKTYKRMQADGRWVKDHLQSLKGCLETRERDLRHAAEAGIPVTDLPSYPGWRTHAKWIQGRIESILEDPGTYGRHLQKIPGAADYMRKALNETDRIWTIDEAPYRRSEAKRARKTQHEQKEQQRRTRGRRMSP